MLVKFCYSCYIHGIIASTVVLDSGNTQDALSFFEHELHDTLRDNHITLTLENILFRGHKTISL